jgi:hypothetical protein
MRRIPVIPVVLTLTTLLIIVGVYLVLQDFQKKAIQTSADPFLWISADAEMIFHFRQPALLRESLLQTGPLEKDFDSIVGLRGATEFVYKLDSLINTNMDIFALWSTSQIVMEVNPTSDSLQMGFTMQITMPSSADALLIGQFMRESVFSNRSINEGVQNSENIYVVSAGNAPTVYYYVLRNNALIVTTRADMLGLRDMEQQTTKSIISNHHFASIRAVAGRFSDNLYVKAKTLCNWLPDSLQHYLPFNIPCKNMADWQLWDLSYHSGGVYLSGFAQSDIYGESFIDNLSGQQKVVSNFAEYIPVNPAFFVWIGLSDKENFSRMFKDWLEINETENPLENHLEIYADSLGMNPDSLPDIWNGEIAWVKPSNPTAQLSEDGVLLLGTQNRELLFDDQEFQMVITDVSMMVENDSLYVPQIFKVDIPGLFPVLTHGLVKKNFEYIAYLDENYLIAGRTSEYLIAYLEAIKFGRHFTKSEDYVQITESMPEGQSLLFYHSGIHHSSKEKSTTAFTDSVAAVDSLQISEIRNERKDFRSFALQILPSSGNKVFSNAMWLHRTEYDLSNPLVWEISLNAPILKGPFKVFNHNDGFTEFIMQDVSNILYLVDIDGNIIWRKELSGPIMSEISQVDVYKNERYQFLFNTRNYLHLIDRNGEYVRGYPMRLPNPASAGISVFDYDNNKNYRILFPAENRMVYNYNIRREQVAGWKFKQSENIIKHALQHFRLDDKDYLVTIDTTGKVNILDRTGMQRIKTRRPLFASHKVFAHAPAEAKPHFIVAGINGTINQVFTDGIVHDFIPDTISEDYRFTYQSFTHNNEKDLVFLHDGNLTTYNIASRMIFSLPLSRELEGLLKIMEISGFGRFAAITDKANSRLFLVNSEGKIPFQFPLEGDTTFLIEVNEDGDIFLITGLREKLRKYNINIKEQF